MSEAVTREEVLSIRARVASLDRAVAALIKASPYPQQVMESLRRDLQHLDTSFEAMAPILPEQSGEREALREAVRVDLTRTIERYEKGSMG